MEYSGSSIRGSHRRSGDVGSEHYDDSKYDESSKNGSDSPEDDESGESEHENPEMSMDLGQFPNDQTLSK